MRLRNWFVAAASALALVFAVNLARVTVPAWLGQSANNATQVTFIAHYAYWVDPTSITIDLVSASSSARKVDIDFGLFAIAEAFREREFDTIHLARWAGTRFLMSGYNFALIGRRSFGGQGNMFLVGALPSMLRYPSGSAAFGEWTGGWIGVMGKQLEDHESFIRQWIGD